MELFFVLFANSENINIFAPRNKNKYFIIMNNYETVFILTPVLSDAQVEEAVKKFEDLIKDNGCEIVAKENWGLKKLAYPIQLKKNGFYTLIEFKGEG